MGQSEFTGLKVANTLSFAFTVTMNALSNAKIWSDNTIGDVSDRNPTILTPSGWAFSIWGIIYTLMALFVLYQLIYPCVAKDANRHLLFSDIGHLYWISNLLNVLWVALFVLDEDWTWIVTTCVLFSLAIVNIIVMQKVSRASRNLWETIILYPLWALYGGWTTAAFVLNCSGCITHFADDPMSAISMKTSYGIAVLITLAIAYTVNGLLAPYNGFFTFVLTWVGIGVYTEMKDDESGFATLALIVGLANLVPTILFWIKGLCMPNPQADAKAESHQPLTV